MSQTVLLLMIVECAVLLLTTRGQKAVECAWTDLIGAFTPCYNYRNYKISTPILVELIITACAMGIF